MPMEQEEIKWVEPGSGVTFSTGEYSGLSNSGQEQQVGEIRSLKKGRDGQSQSPITVRGPSLDPFRLFLFPSSFRFLTSLAGYLSKARLQDAFCTLH